MRFLLDMGMSPRITAWLREANHDAVHVRQIGFQRSPDEDIVSRAADERRIVLTFDLDFPRMLALQRLAQPSIVLFRLSEFTTDQLHVILQAVIDEHRAALESGAIVVVDDDRIRVRSLPIW